jgi:hypothetical protein
MNQLPLILILASAAVAQGVDPPTAITIPLEEGKLTIVAQFIRVNKYGDYVPELSFGLTNETSSAWRTIRLQFDIGGICNGKTRQWSIPAVVGIAYTLDRPMMKTYADTVIPLVGKVDGCETEIIKASLVSAESSKVHIDRVTGERVDLEKQLQELKAKRDAEAAVKAEVQRRAAEEELKAAEAEAKMEAAEAAAQAEAQAKKQAAEAARQKRLAAEEKRKDAERDALISKYRAEQEAAAAEERRKIRAACAAIYKSTADMKIKDLTVKEEQQVRACQALGLYRPQ